MLSPWPLEEPRKLVLPHGARGSGLRRSATVATVVRGAQRIRVYSLHLPSPLAVSGGSRREQLRVLGADAAASADPVLIAGDFNSHGKVAELERAGFAWLTRGLGDTTRFRLLGIPITGLSYDHFLAKGLRLARRRGRARRRRRTTTTRATTCRSGRCSCPRTPRLAEAGGTDTPGRVPVRMLA